MGPLWSNVMVPWLPFAERGSPNARACGRGDAGTAHDDNPLACLVGDVPRRNWSSAGLHEALLRWALTVPAESSDSDNSRRSFRS